MAVVLATTAWLAPNVARAAEEKPAAPAASPTTGVMYSSLVTVTAKVESIDLEKRLVTVRGEGVVEIECGPEVRNLPGEGGRHGRGRKYQESSPSI
jgi:hypothetical protein